MESKIVAKGKDYVVRRLTPKEDFELMSYFERERRIAEGDIIVSMFYLESIEGNMNGVKPNYRGTNHGN